MSGNKVTSADLIQLLEDHPENLKLFRMKAPDEAVRSLVAKELTDAEAKALAAGVMKDPVIQLYVASDGSIDGRELMDYVHQSGGVTRGGNENPGVRSLLNGKLDIKTLLLIVALMKLFAGSNQQSNQGGSLISSLLGSTLGASPAGNNGSLGLLSTLFGAGSSVPNSTQSSMNLLGTLLGASQPQYQPQSQSESLLGTLLGASQPQYQQPQSQSLLGTLLGASQMASQTQTQQPNSSALLQQLLQAGMAQQTASQAQPQVKPQSHSQVKPQSHSQQVKPQALGQQVYALDGTAPQQYNSSQQPQFNASQSQQIQNLLSGSDSVHSNGQINVGNLFSIASALLGQ